MELDLTSQTQLYLGLYERETGRSLKELSRGIQTGIDIGSAEGEYALYFLSKPWCKKVFAFDPCTTAYEQFRLNLKLNRFEHALRLQAFNKFVGHSNDEQTCTMDSLFDSIVLPCLVKIDVEGGEVAILRGAQKLLASLQVRWLIETHSAQLERQCLDILREAGYWTRIIPNAWWRLFLPELRPIPHNRWLVATPVEPVIPPKLR